MNKRWHSPLERVKNVQKRISSTLVQGTTMKHPLISLLILAAAVLAAPQTAAADTASASARLTNTVVSGGNPALARVNVHAKFSSVDSVCFDFTFQNDLLDPGEIVLITPLQLFPSLTGGGFEDVGPGSLSERLFCYESAFQPDVTALFADGKDKDLEIGTQGGSVEIASVVVTVTGTPR
jgi:hypothetical protein